MLERMEDRRLYVKLRAEYVARLEKRAWPNHRSLSEEAAWLIELALDELDRREAADAVVAVA